MPIHHTQKAKYQRLKDSGLTAEELKAEIIANQPEDVTKQVPLTEIEQFISELYKVTEQVVANDQGNAPPAPTVNPNVSATNQQQTAPSTASCGTAPKFDYRNLNGKEYEAYIGYVESLPLFDLRPFDCFKAQPIMKERYPGMPNSPWDMVGVEITTDKALHTTKIDIKTANELNAQLANSKRIYLLKQ
jgi:hypothetical protein